MTQRLVGALAAAALLTSMGVASASADAEPKSRTITSPMYAVGFDAKVAAENGFRIVTRADGTQASVPVTAAAKLSEASAGLVTTMGTVKGDCGTSTVELLDAGGSKAAVGTGFNLTRGAVSYNWSVSVAGGGSSYTKNFSGGLLSRHSWTGSFSWTVPKSATYVAGVTRASNAILNNGTICFSGMPTSTYYVYR